MQHRVQVALPVDYDYAEVAEVLGEEPLPLDLSDLVLAPYVTIDGRIHGPSSDFLREFARSRPNTDTVRRIASDLASWVRFLCNDCCLPPFEDARDPVLVATEDHFARYYRLRQYGDPDQLLSPDGWRRAASSIKRLYEYSQRRYGHQPPFDIVRFTHTQGYTGTTIAGFAPRRRNTGSAGRPLTPLYADYLLMGATRTDLAARQDAYRGADRDYAILSLGLGAGLRRNNLANVTVYEIPYASGMRLTTMRVADSITKGDAGGDAFVFTHRLRAVHDYVEGQRSEVLAGRRHRPLHPLHIVEVDAEGVRFVDDAKKTRRRRWADLSENERRRLVDVDGTTPILFVNEYTGAPLSWESMRYAVEGARDFVRERIEPDFPVGFRMHDLRHTYAVHLAVAIYRGVVADIVAPHRSEDWAVEHLTAAVELVKFSLGHASEQSTRLYVQTAHRFLDIPIAQFFGEF